jgi:hypothetical protein
MELLGAGGMIAASAGGLPIDGHNLPVGRFLNPARPGPKAMLKVRWLDLAKYSPERVMGRNPALEGQKFPEPIELRFPLAPRALQNRQHR